MLNPGTFNASELDRESISDELVVAISVYLASYLTGHPRTPYEVADAIGHEISGGIIYSIYTWVIDRNGLIDGGIRDELDVVFNIQTITWPQEIRR